MSTFSIDNMTCFAVNIEHNIAHIQLNCPQRLNSMIPEFWSELPALIEYIDENSLARVIVISSTGKHFSAGMDLSVFTNMSADKVQDPARHAEAQRRHILRLQACFNALENARIPVLAAVQGGAIGGALDMISACDCRYASQDAFFCIKETQIGMTADVGTLQRLPHLMPQGLMRELAYTGRNMDSAEALRVGFINQVFETHDALLAGVMHIAKHIASHSPIAVNGCKEMINYARDHSVADSLNYMATWQSGMLQMADIETALAAAKAQQTPSFENLQPIKKTF